MLKSTTERDRLAREVESARTATLAWLASMQAQGQPVASCAQRSA